ncbi:MAG: hypothetical protein C5B55_01820 [Blastocatellia bacterium]|nr:MAG: hypothetical protein C5B55_01820 [Blastocatellia bacterium]
MIKTKGLTHLHLMVKDVQRSLAFYKTVFGMEEQFWGTPELVFLQTPGSNDLIALHQAEDREATGVSGGILHFGFALTDDQSLDAAIEEVISAGGTLKKRGEFRPGLPFAYVRDPDGYEIEL